MAELYNPLAVMKIRNDAGLKSVVGATYGKDVRWKNGPRAHQGWDLYAALNTPVYALGGGVVIWTKNAGDYGNQVLVQFNKDGSTMMSDPALTRYAFYAHLSEIGVKKGDFVSAGQELGKTGATGNASAKYPHLHFEIRSNPSERLGRGLDGRVDPAEVLGYHHLSCNVEEEKDPDKTETVGMMCRVPDGPTTVGSESSSSEGTTTTVLP